MPFLIGKEKIFVKTTIIRYTQHHMKTEKNIEQTLIWIDSQAKEMCALVKKWALINSGSTNLEGLEQMSSELRTAFSRLHPDVSEVLPHTCLHFAKRQNARYRILCVGHFDTVFSKEHSFKKISEKEDVFLNGPGVADMKGGLVVMLTALEALERSPYSHNLGWDILLNSDEETGSIHSASYLKTYAKSCDAALVFEPCFIDGSLVSARKGSSTYSISSFGKSAHAGRDFKSGKNAILPLAKWTIEMAEKWNLVDEIQFNVGWIQGGTAANVVPDVAKALVNVRTRTQPQLANLEQDMFLRAQNAGLKIERLSYRPPKPLSADLEHMLTDLQQCGQMLGLTFSWRESGGVCDGNNLAALGLPCVDTLGVQGDFIHTDRELMLISSLPERAKLTALFLMKMSTGEITLEKRRLT